MKEDRISLKPCKLRGEIEAISSKSYAHRVLILAALSKSVVDIYINEISEDIRVTIEALEELGVGIEKFDDRVRLRPSSRKLDHATINMKESGSSLRFFTAVSPHFSKKTTIIGGERLSKRPSFLLIESLRKNGLNISGDKIPLIISGEFKGGYFNMESAQSSQFITALLLSASVSKNTFIRVDRLMESIGYVNISLDVLKSFNVDVIKEGFSYRVIDPKIKAPKNYYVEGDWSNAAFFYGANLMGAKVKVKNLNKNSLQRDKEIISVIDKIRNYKKSGQILKIDVGQIPDLVPIIAILLTLLDKPSYIINGKRLRYKESDRLISTCKMLNDLGARAKIMGDNLEIGGKIRGGIVDSFNDHRIVMAASMASNISSEDISITNYKAVSKSYPNFFNDLKKLGAKVK